MALEAVCAISFQQRRLLSHIVSSVNVPVTKVKENISDIIRRSTSSLGRKKVATCSSNQMEID